jgi:hypothetical protein
MAQALEQGVVDDSGERAGAGERGSSKGLGVIRGVLRFDDAFFQCVGGHDLTAPFAPAFMVQVVIRGNRMA